MTVGGDLQLPASDRVLETHPQDFYPLVWEDGAEKTFLLQIRTQKLRGITCPVQGHSTHYKSDTQGTGILLHQTQFLG